MELRRAFRCINILLFPIIFITPVYAEEKTPAIIIPYDTISSPGIVVWPQAKVLTKKFQIMERPVSGERIEFLEEDRYLGLALTGGDGIGVIRYTPLNEGIHKIKVKIQSGSAYAAEDREMLIGVWDRSKGLLIISVEAMQEKPKGGIFPFFGKIKKDTGRHPLDQAVNVLSDLSKRFNIIYLSYSEASNLAEIKTWLNKNKFPDSPLLIWDDNKRLINNLISGRKKDIRGVVLTSGDEADIFQKEQIRTLVLTEKKKRTENKKGLKEAIIVTDWKEIKKEIE